MATSEIEKFATLIVGEMHDMEGRLTERMDGMDTRFDQMDARFDRVDTRFDQMNIRFDRIESELSFINKRLDALEEQGASNTGFAKEIDDLRSRVKIMEAKLAKA